MNIVNENARVAIFCTVVNESRERVRIRIANTWDVDVFKEMIDGVEPDIDSAQAQLVSFFEA
ncbi:MAG TPA: hypothetical protein VFI75_00895 [Candidatus Acidoferrum sp.]|nr:hypothetical protein [Candidatus Acidoferrum sp.]